MTDANTTDQKQPLVDWEPTPGCILVKPLKREEVAAALYGKTSSNSLSMPDNMGKVSDSVGVGVVIKVGGMNIGEIAEYRKLAISNSDANDYGLSEETIKKAGKNALDARLVYEVQPGDYVAYMPYTDLLIEIDSKKYALIEYSKIRGVRKG